MQKVDYEEENILDVITPEMTVFDLDKQSANQRKIFLAEINLEYKNFIII